MRVSITTSFPEDDQSKAALSQAACPRCAYEQVRRLRRQLRLDWVVVPEVLWTPPWQPTFYGALELQEQVRLERLERDLA